MIHYGKLIGNIVCYFSLLNDSNYIISEYSNR